MLRTKGSASLVIKSVSDIERSGIFPVTIGDSLPILFTFWTDVPANSSIELHAQTMALFLCLFPECAKGEILSAERYSARTICLFLSRALSLSFSLAQSLSRVCSLCRSLSTLTSTLPQLTTYARSKLNTVLYFCHKTQPIGALEGRRILIGWLVSS